MNEYDILEKLVGVIVVIEVMLGRFLVSYLCCDEIFEVVEDQVKFMMLIVGVMCDVRDVMGYYLFFEMVKGVVYFVGEVVMMFVDLQKD